MSFLSAIPTFVKSRTDSLISTRHIRPLPYELYKILEQAFIYVRSCFQCEGGVIYLFDRELETLRSVLIMERGQILEGEEELVLSRKAPLGKLFSGGKDMLAIRGHGYCTLYMPMTKYKEKIGLVRLYRHTEFSRSERQAVTGVVSEAANAIWDILLNIELSRMAWRAQLFNDINALIHQSLQLGELLRAAARSLVVSMGFDRIQIFLVDSERKTLRGEIGYSIAGGMFDLKNALYHIKPGVNDIVDVIAVNGKPHKKILQKYSNTIRYIPLRAGGEVMGILMVDNLLSQIEFTGDDIQFLDTIGGQLGLAIKNAVLYKGVEELSITDGLTGLYVMRYFKVRLDQECHRASRGQSPFSLVIFDMDNFKHKNDEFGHPAGDAILKEIAARTRATSRNIDLLARYGGDEFLVLLPGTDAREAVRFTRRLRKAIVDTAIKLPSGHEVKITVSIGTAVYPDHAKSAEDLIAKADEAMYMAKSLGRDRICLYGDRTEK